jgi:hypothetical protein
LFNTNYIPADLSGTAKLPPLKETVVRQTLASLGYSTITFENRFSGHFDLGEDLRISDNQLVLGNLNLLGGVNEFEEMTLQTSIAKLFLDTEIIPGFNEDTLVRFENYNHYKQTYFILSSLANDVPDMKGPKFVFAHIMVPHGPFVFTADGKFKKAEDQGRNGYSDNAEFIDRQILPAIQSIVSKSAQPPIIVLMGDHGPPPGKHATREDRMKNLNAYLVSPETAADLYESITPVNSFRVIFNHYFGKSYPILPDISYYAYKPKQLNNAEVMQNICKSTR